MSIGLKFIRKGEDLHPDTLIKTYLNPIILNDEPDIRSAKERIIKFMTTTISDDVDILPSCHCESTKEPVSIGMTLGNEEKYCGICGTKVELPFEKDIMPFVFVRSPKGMAGFLDFTFLLMLMDTFYLKKFSVIHYLMDSRYATIDAGIVRYLETNGITERGYNYFINNIRNIVKVLSSCPNFKFKKRVSKNKLLTLFDMYEKDIITEYIYLPNKSLMLLDETNSFTYSHDSLRSLINSALMFSSIDTSDELTARNKDNRTTSAVFALADFWKAHLELMMNSDKNIFRKHIYSLRSVWGMRLTMTSNTTSLNHDEVLLPWAPTIQCLTQLIAGSLCAKFNYRLEDALLRVTRASTKYDKDIHDILLEESAKGYEGCFHVIMQRYPSLLIGNISLMRVVIGIDPTVLYAAVSPLSITSSNMDFDGDQAHFTFVFGDRLVSDMYKLRKHVYNLDIRKPRSLSRFFESTKQCVSITDSFFNSDEVEVMVDKKMLQDTLKVLH